MSSNIKRRKDRLRGPSARIVRSLLLAALFILCSLPLSAQEDWYIGKPIADFTFIGLDTVSENELVPLVRPYIGMEFSLEVFWEVQEILYALDYFEAIEANAEPGDDARESVIIAFTVQEKPSVEEVVLEGNRRLRKGEILENVLIAPGDMISDIQADLDAQAITDLYIEKGYIDATVEAVLEPGDQENTVVVKFLISEGTQTAIKAIVFSGNTFASEGTLRRQMKTKPQSLFSPGVFQELKFEEDRQRILDYYTERGYIDAKIEEVERTVEKDPEEGKNYLIITIYIDEGQQWTYGGMDFEGNTIFSDEELLELVRQQPGKILDKLKLEADTQRVADLYYENGYIFNVINREERRNPENQEISYTIRIVETDRAHIENVIIKGNEKTKDYVIYRELPFEEGDIFSKAKVLEGLRNLYNLQYFSSIQPETPPGSADGLMDLVINVEEGSTANINFGVMFAGGDYPISGMLKWEENNFLGRGQALGINAELSTLRQLISLSFEEPWLLGRRWLGGVSISFEHAIVPNVSTDSLFPVFSGSEENAVPDPYLGYWVDPDTGLPIDSSDPNWDNRITDYQYALSQGVSIPDQYLMDYTLWKFGLGFTMGYRHPTPLGWLGVRSGISTSLEQLTYDAGLFRPFDPELRAGHEAWKNVNKLGITLYWDKRDFFLNPTKGFYIAQGVTFAVGFPLGTREYIRTDSTLEGFLTLVDVPAFENWNFKLVLAAHTSWSFIFPQFWRSEALTIVNDELYIDGWNIARGWPLERELKTVWDNRLELRMPISQQLLWWVFFLDGVIGAQEISDLRTWAENKQFLENFYFSIGGGIRFTIPQFPIRLYLAKRFKYDSVEGWQWLDGDLPFFFNSTVEFVISLGGDTFF
ncbi:MAG: outer membrane protein assembly factor BamA [Spirochaetaceae bacterium]|nr:MAG: outer membrane protein assembly factor BamA [Spirochaetaceae bacterium]